MQPKFSKYNFDIQVKEGKQYIYDIVRKKYVLLLPEEWIRQHALHYLIYDYAYPKALISVEKQVLLNGLAKRTDILLYTQSGKPVLIGECKADSIKITQKTFEQIAQYNMILQVPYLWVTNGRTHFLSEIDYEKKSFAFLTELPDKNKLF